MATSGVQLSSCACYLYLYLLWRLSLEKNFRPFSFGLCGCELMNGQLGWECQTEPSQHGSGKDPPQDSCRNGRKREQEVGGFHHFSGWAPWPLFSSRKFWWFFFKGNLAAFSLQSSFDPRVISWPPVEMPQTSGTDPSTTLKYGHWCLQPRPLGRPSADPSLVSHHRPLSRLTRMCVGHCGGLQALAWSLLVSTAHTLHSSTSHWSKHQLRQAAFLLLVYTSPFCALHTTPPQIYDLQMSSPILRLIFSLSWWHSSKHQLFNFDEIQDFSLFFVPFHAFAVVSEEAMCIQGHKNLLFLFLIVSLSSYI